MHDFESGVVAELHGLLGQGEDAAYHGLGGDDRGYHGQSYHKAERAAPAVKVVGRGLGTGQEQGFLAKVIDEQAGIDQGELGGADGPPPKVVQVGGEALAIGDTIEAHY
jgi:hypothetical protein